MRLPDLRPETALRLLLVPLAVGGFLRFRAAAEHYRDAYPQLAGDESYY